MHNKAYHAPGGKETTCTATWDIIGLDKQTFFSVGNSRGGLGRGAGGGAGAGGTGVLKLPWRNKLPL